MFLMNNDNPSDDNNSDNSDSSSQSSTHSSEYIDFSHCSASDVEIVCDEVFVRHKKR